MSHVSSNGPPLHHARRIFPPTCPVEKFMVEKSGVEKSGVGKFMVEKLGVEMSTFLKLR